MNKDKMAEIILIAMAFMATPMVFLAFAGFTGFAAIDPAVWITIGMSVALSIMFAIEKIL